MRQRVSRSLTLLWAFVDLSALILVLGGLVLGTILTRALRDQALADAKESLTQYTNGVLGRHLSTGVNLRTATAPGARSENNAKPDRANVSPFVQPSYDGR